jgi:lipopolysaccharide export LptBFGC system permease protein LptF
VRVPRTLWVALWREVAGHAALGLAAVALLYLGRNLLRYVERLHALGAGPWDVAQVAACVATVMAAHALPVAFLFGLAVALSRMAADGEAQALRACGVGLAALVAPLVALALAVAAATGVASLDLEPRARRGLREAFHAMAARGALLEPGRFREIAGRTLFVRSRAPDGALEGVLVEDRSQPERPFVLFAERGTWRWDAAQARVRLHLERGDVLFEAPRSEAEPSEVRAPASKAAERPRSEAEPSEARAPASKAAERPRSEAQASGVRAPASKAAERPRSEAEPSEARAPARMTFATLDYAFPVDELAAAGPGDLLPKDMSLAELRAAVALARAGGSLAHLEKTRVEHYEIAIQRRYALPAAPVVLALAGIPLALRPGRGARARGALLCAVLAFGYYAAFVAARAVALAGGLPAVAAPWLPNAAFAAAGIVLLARARRVPG